MNPALTNPNAAIMICDWEMVIMRLFAKLSETKMMFIYHSSNSVTEINTLSSKPISSLLNEDSNLTPVLQRLKVISNLQQTYFDAAPDSLKNSSRVTRIEGTTIVISVPNGAVATKLKLLAPTLLERFMKNKKQEQKVTAICVEVQPDLSTSTQSASQAWPRNPIPLSNLDELSRQLSDSPLKDIVDALRNNRKRRDAYISKNRSST